MSIINTYGYFRIATQTVPVVPDFLWYRYKFQK